MRKTFGAATAAMLVVSIGLVAAPKDQTGKFHEAATVLREIHAAPDKGIPNELWEKASCVAVFPSLKKAAFFVGGEFGKGVMSCRDGSSWSAPAIMEMQKGSFGLQIGGETVDLVLLVMNREGANRFLENKVSLGGEASVAGGPVGRDARAMTNAQIKAQVLTYSRSQGLFAGIDISGGTLEPDHSDNNDLYGRTITAREIVVGKNVSAPKEAAEFMTALKQTIPARD
jgi:lipid-binding SYLF domain-containing protein